NLTVPLKEIVLPLLDAITHEAERIGAVNTLLFPPGGRTVGDNTDGRGFLAALRGRVRLSGARALVIGAGGSARAVGAALCQIGAARITIANRTPARAERLAERLGRLGAGATAAVPLAALRHDELPSRRCPPEARRPDRRAGHARHRAAAGARRRPLHPSRTPRLRDRGEAPLLPRARIPPAGRRSPLPRHPARGAGHR